MLRIATIRSLLVHPLGTDLGGISNLKLKPQLDDQISNQRDCLLASMPTRTPAPRCFSSRSNSSGNGHGGLPRHATDRSEHPDAAIQIFPIVDGKIVESWAVRVRFSGFPCCTHVQRPRDFPD